MNVPELAAVYTYTCYQISINQQSEHKNMLILYNFALSYFIQIYARTIRSHTNTYGCDTKIEKFCGCVNTSCYYESHIHEYHLLLL